MSAIVDPKDAAGAIISLATHDLRNALAAADASLEYLRSIAVARDSASDLEETLQDTSESLKALMSGIERLDQLGRWIDGRPGVALRDLELASLLRSIGSRHPNLALANELPEQTLTLKNGSALLQIIELLLDNVRQHSTLESARIVICNYRGAPAIEIHDAGKAIREDLREHVFTAKGQAQLRNTAHGRYSRFLGQLAARALADSCGATLEATEINQQNVFRICPISSISA